MLDYNNLQREAEKLDPVRDADKIRLVEINERHFEVIILIL